MIFYVTLQNQLVKTDDLSLNQLILCIADLLVASEGIVNINTSELSSLTHCTTCGKCTGPKKLSDKDMAYWNLHTNFQLPSVMGLRDFYFPSQAVLMGGSPLSHSAMLVPKGRVKKKTQFLSTFCG